MNTPGREAVACNVVCGCETARGYPWLPLTRRTLRLASRGFGMALLALLGIVICLLPATAHSRLPEWLLFVGRFHPLILHLPIGLLVLLPILHVLARLCPPGALRPAIVTVLWLCAASTVAATVCGMLLSQEAGYDGVTLHLHRQFASGLSVFTILLLVCESEGEQLEIAGAGWARLSHQAYRVLLPLTLVSLGIAAHLGATLTHGSTFLTEHLKFLGKPVATAEVSKKAALASGPEETYASKVAPILQAHCTSCHGAEKAKGGLRLHTLSAVLAGGDSQREENAPGVVPGSAERSLLIRVLCLPADDDAHMPPLGKSQLTATEIDTLRRWIDTGAG